MRQSDSNLTPASLISGLLILFFAGIVFFTLFANAEVQNFATFCPVIVFASINLVVLLTLALCSGVLSHTVPFATLVSIWFVTILYTLAQFIHLAFSYRSIRVTDYILYHLIVLFLYFLIVVPAALIGARKNK